MKIWILILLTSVSLNALAQYRGTVYNDVNKNRRMDLGEPVMAGVRVSDGLNVIKSDRDGKFELPGYAKTRFIFISSPAGFIPSGEHYKRAESRDSLYNFGLVQDSMTAGAKVRMLHISDTETDIYGNWIANIRNFSKDQLGSFVVHTGDICYEKGLKFHAAQVNTRMLQRPIHYAMGNHDLVKGPYGEDLFESLFGPPYYSFDAGPAHFIITPMASGDYRPDYTTDQVIAWIRNDLAQTDKNRPVFIFNHDLPFKFGDFTLRGKTDSIQLDKHGLKAWIYGHYHSDFVQQDARTGIYTICTAPPNKGGIDNSMGRFLSIDINAQGIADIQPQFVNLKEHVTIVQPANSMNVVKNGKLQLCINAYDSEFAIKSVLFSLYDSKGRRVAQKALNKVFQWNWRSEIAADMLSSGKYTAMAEVLYVNGRTTIRKQEFNYSKQPTSKLLWSANVGGNVWKAAPLAVADKIFVGVVDDEMNVHCGITALNAKTGAVLWHYRTKNSIKGVLNYYEGMVISTDQEGIAYAVDASSGKLIWKTSLEHTRLPGNLIGGVISNGVYYTGEGRFMKALNARTGSIIWSNNSWGTGESCPAQMTIAGDLLITGGNWNALFAHDVKTGRLVWKRADDGLRFRSGKVAYKDGKLYATGLDGLFELEPSTGKTLRKVNTGFDFKVTGEPLVTDDLIILSSSASGVLAYDKNTFKLRWRRPVGEALIYTAPYFSPDNLNPIQTVEAGVVKNQKSLFFGGADGGLYQLNESDGNVIRKLNVGAPVYAEMVFSGNRYYVADFMGNVYAFEL